MCLNDNGDWADVKRGKILILKIWVNARLTHVLLEIIRSYVDKF